MNNPPTILLVFAAPRGSNIYQKSIQNRPSLKMNNPPAFLLFFLAFARGPTDAQQAHAKNDQPSITFACF